MITVRRAEDRHHDQGRNHDVWLTFSRDGASGLYRSFGALELLDESRLSPGGVMLGHSSRDAEIVTFVREGALSWKDSNGCSGLVQAGEFRRWTVGRGLRQREINASQSDGAHVFQIWLRAAQVDLVPSHEQRRFSAAERRGRLCVVCSPDGRRASFSIRQDAFLFSALLDPGMHVVHGLLPGRSAWLHIVSGKARLGEVVLSKGDGAGLSSELAVSLTAQQQTELLLLDLGASPEPAREPASGRVRGASG